MKVKPEDADLFYELFFPILDYVNEKYHVTAENIKFVRRKIDPKDAIEVANFLWERTWILDDYLSENQFSDTKREIISNWKRCIFGKFIIERHLKKGSIFISMDDNTVYLVQGLIDSWEEMIPEPTPIIVKTVLLPFQNLIITDGLVSVSLIRFGRTYTADLKDIYMTAKQQHSIISRI